ncbi:MAG: hypothetical protein HQ481_14180 [Alphaproteobacteria bacterium]|nr:hypothetical protein [Alphaproteobacteria bacterium]
MNTSDYERLLKLVAMLGSTNDGEVLNAVAAASRVMNGYGLDWSDIVLPRKLLPVRANVTEDLPLDEEELADAPPPLDKATPKVMYELLLASNNVSSDVKRDIRRHFGAIRDGRITPAIRGELQTMYNYAILKGLSI